MKRFFSAYSHIFQAVTLISVLALVIVVCRQEKKLQEREILFAGDVGIIRLFYEEIESVKFDSFIPTVNENCEDISVIMPLLDLLSTAIFLPIDPPVEPYTWGESICIETKENMYSIGVLDGFFRVGINGVSNYYTCSAADAFITKLLEIQGR